jgi:ABC-type amino acid transport substrate-binding protein
MRSRRSVAFCLGACLFLAGVAGTGRAWGQEDDALAQIRQKGSLEVAVYAEFPPFSSGKSAEDAKGIDVDLARAIAQQLGVKLRLRLVSAGESTSDDLRNHIWKGHYMGGGVADVMLHVGYDPVFADHEKSVILFAPYFHETVVVAYAPTRIPHLESPIALSEHRIAVEGDTISDHIMSSAYGGSLRKAAVRELSLEEAASAYKGGTVDAVMGPKGELQGLFNELGVTGVSFRPQESIGPMRTSWDIGLAVKRDGGADLSEAVGKVVMTLQANGTLREIFKHYGVDWIEGRGL